MQRERERPDVQWLLDGQHSVTRQGAKEDRHKEAAAESAKEATKESRYLRQAAEREMWVEI